MAERNNLPVPEEPDFSTQIEEILPEDPVHAAQINEIFTRLLTNDAFLDKLASKMVEKALIAHVLDSVNPNMVLGADQAPVLTGLIDEQKERITKLYSDLEIKTGMAIIDNNSPFEFLINRYYKIGKIVFLEIFANKKDRAVFESGRITIGDLNPSIIPTIEVSGIASASNVIGGYINRQCGFLIPKNTIHIDNFFGSDITYVAINAVYVCGNV